MPDDTSQRKREHLDAALSDSSQYLRTSGWEDVHLVHQSIPTRSLQGIDTTTHFLGHELRAPVVIASMTGGHEAAEEINARLAAAAEVLGIAIGVGSQRAALEDPALEPTYAVVRKHAPTALVMANLGVCQLVPQEDRPAFDAGTIERAVGMIDADALAIHLNIAEEIVQVEGDRNFDDLSDAIERLTDTSSVPVIAKETGSGLARESARSLVDRGVAAVDVGGSGGTSFVLVEAARAARQGDRRAAQLGETFSEWGIPTAASVLDIADVGVPVIATGGVRNGVHAAKALALGADLVGVGRPALRAALEGTGAVIERLETLIEELRVAALLTGHRRTRDLGRSDAVLTGFTREWATQRGRIAL
jgi:isopentenyl-diphosphate Delta-isomerase